MGKSTISMAIFNSYFDITRGYQTWQESLGPQCSTPHRYTSMWAFKVAKSHGAMGWETTCTWHYWVIPGMTQEWQGQLRSLSTTDSLDGLNLQIYIYTYIGQSFVQNSFFCDLTWFNHESLCWSLVPDVKVVSRPIGWCFVSLSPIHMIHGYIPYISMWIPHIYIYTYTYIHIYIYTYIHIISI